jgi:hypothetical protein
MLISGRNSSWMMGVHVVTDMLKSLPTKLMLAVLLFSSSASCAVSEQWVYHDPLRPNQLFSINTVPASFGVNDVQYDAEFCDLKDAYYCVKSSQFTFYVPKKLTESIREWKAGGDTYVIAFTSRVSLLGLEDNILFIDKRRKDGEGTIRFLYSKSRGLVGMGGFTDNSSAIFLLDIDCGFGAPSDCSAISR